MDYVEIIGVEIGSVGMEWRATGGLFTLTTQNLIDVATAANDDPHIVVPRLKLGHEGWPDNDGLDSNPFAAAPSAEPAVGRARNFRLTNDGATLATDFFDVPAWIPAAYPSRSPEWIGEVDPTINTGVLTPGGKRYSMVITAIALLGVCWPALQDIDDLPSLQHFLATGTVLERPVVITTNLEDQMPQPVATRADIDTVSRSFWSEFATGERVWWWTRDIFTDPNEVLADDDEGHLFRVPFTSNADGDVTWGEPVRVRVDLVDLPDLEPAATSALVATAHRAVMTAAAGTHRTFATAAAARPVERQTQKAAADVAAATNQAAVEAPDNERNPMDDSVRKALARQHGLDPETATEDDVNAAVLAANDGASDPDPDEPDESLEVAATSGDDPLTAKVELLERQNTELLSDKRAREITAAAAKQAERVKLVGIATSIGVLKPHEVDTWTTRVKDPEKGEGFAEVLATMIADKDPSVPTIELGSDDAFATLVDDSGDLPQNLSLLTPAERAAVAARRGV